jgi:hypothetical protein
VLRSLLERASRSGEIVSGVLGVRAIPRWDGPETIAQHGVTAQVRTCVSPLAVREAVRSKPEDGWLIVLTDRDED